MAPPGRRRSELSSFTVLLGLLFLFASTASAASAVLGIDFGTEYIKAAIVKPGIPLEIVLTKDSKRKEASAVAFKQSKSGSQSADYPERAYGGDALALSARFPADVYPNLKPLLGKSFEDSSIVQEYSRLRPALQLSEREGRKTIAFKSKSFGEDEKAFSVEELLAMVLQNVRDNAKTMAGKGTSISEVVFTVPPFFTADEKRALETAANLAGFKVIGLVTDGLAVGINYATSRTFPDITKDGNKPEYHLVFDMGAGSTSASILRFQGKTVKDIGRFNKTIQEVAVLGSGWDKTLGGDALNAVIVDDMVAKFKETSGKSLSATAEDIKKHGRTMSKLWSQAEKSRQILSANSATTAFFESFYEDVDFRYKLSRTEFEDLTVAFASRVDAPITQALLHAGLIWSDLNSVILHGGAARTPFIQKRLESIADDKSKLKTNVNADEAAVFGAAFKAAGLSPSFKVKEIKDQDTSGFSAGLLYNHNSKERVQKLFTPVSQAGVAKQIPFKNLDEFEFTLFQEVHVGSGSPVRAPVVHGKTSNMTQTVAKLIEDGCTREDIETSWSVRINPVNYLPEISKGLVRCEFEEVEKEGGVLGGVKDFLGFGNKKGDQEPLKDDAADASESSAEPPSSSSSAAEAAPSKDADSKDDAKAKESAKPKVPKKKIVSSGVKVEIEFKGYEEYPKAEWTTMKDRLSAFDKSDKARRDRAELHNSLEAFTYRARDLLDEEGFIAASTAEIRDKLTEQLSEISDWLYGEGSDASKIVLKEKLKGLTDIVDPITKRRDESTKRPELVKTVQESLRQSKSMIEVIKKSVEDAAEAAASKAAEASKSAESAASAATEPASADPLDELEEGSSSTSSEEPKPTPAHSMFQYTQEDLDSVQKAYDTVESWFTSKLAEQEKLAPHEDAAFSATDIEAKTRDLSSVIMEIVQRQIRESTKQEKAKSKTKTKSKSKSKKSKKPSSSTSSEGSQASMEPVQINLDDLNTGDAPTEGEIRKLVEDALKEQEQKKQPHDEL